MKFPKLIYLASPYSHENPLTLLFRRDYIDIITAEIYKKYKVAIIPPIMISANIKDHLGKNIGTSFKDWKDIDLKYISRCDEIWVAQMEGWKESIGVQAEIEFAVFMNIPIKYIDLKTFKLLTRPSDDNKKKEKNKKKYERI